LLLKVTSRHYCPKIIFQNYCSKTKLIYKNDGSPTLFCKIAPKKNNTESYSPKLSIKLPPKNSYYFSKQLLGILILENLPKFCSPNPIPRNYFPKLYPKISLQNGYPKVLYFKPISQSNSPKLFCKMAPKNCSPKKAFENYSPKLHLNFNFVFPKPPYTKIENSLFWKSSFCVSQKNNRFLRFFFFQLVLSISIYYSANVIRLITDGREINSP
jgi:hypothetical protein